jgi:hypothetical protein
LPGSFITGAETEARVRSIKALGVLTASLFVASCAHDIHPSGTKSSFASAPKEWHRAFSAGGSKTLFVMTPPVPGATVGHRLLVVGDQLWSPHVNAFVRELGY